MFALTYALNSVSSFYYAKDKIERSNINTVFIFCSIDANVDHNFIGFENLIIVYSFDYSIREYSKMTVRTKTIRSK